jgi:hypothetical protein
MTTFSVIWPTRSSSIILTRDTEFFREVEPGDRQIEALLRGIGTKPDDAIITMRPLTRLHHVGLGG